MTTGQAAAEILGGPMGCRVFGIKVVAASAAASVLGVGRPALKGDSPAAPTVFGSIDDGGSTSQSKIALAWDVSPTAPVTFFDRVSVSGAVGFMRDFVFPQGIWIPAKTSLTLHNILGGALFDVTVDMQEMSASGLAFYRDVVMADSPVAYWRLGDNEGYAQAVIADAPLGYWRMDAPSGITETDRSGNNHNGTYNGSFALNQAGVLADGDAAANFSAGNGYLDLGNVASLRPTAAFTIEAWVNLNSAVFPDVSTNWGIYDWQVFNASGVILRVDGTTIKIQAITNQAGANTNAFSNTALTKNAWYHVVFTFDGTTGRFYLNGAPDGSAAFTAPVAAANNVFISRNAQGMVGNMDEVAIYDYAMSATEVAGHYALRTSPVTTLTAPVVTDQVGAWPATVSRGALLRQVGSSPMDVDGAARFDGATGSFIETNAIFNYPIGTGPLSIEFWFKTASVTAQTGIVDNKDAGSGTAGFNVLFADAGATLVFRIANGVSQSSIQTAGGYADNKWHHFVGVLSRATSDTMIIHIDGSVVLGPTILGASGWNITATKKFRIGGYSTGGAPNFFVGLLDEVAIYAQALTAQQVLTHFLAR